MITNKIPGTIDQLGYPNPTLNITSIDIIIKIIDDTNKINIDATNPA
jgi:hypothetical protein